jgi:tetratricopeptide (TPR) repeat protein
MKKILSGVFTIWIILTFFSGCANMPEPVKERFGEFKKTIEDATEKDQDQVKTEEETEAEAASVKRATEVQKKGVTNADKKADAVEEELKKAESFFGTGHYKETLSLANKILKQDASNAQAKHLKNASYYQMAKQLNEQKNYHESLKMFAKVPPDYKDVSEDVAGVKTGMKKQAGVHYRRGVKFFINEKLTEAIGEWEETLRLDPDHKKAKKDIQNAQNLLEKLKKVE